MNNVYVGNRYVPVFANPVEWDNLRTYEALTIVTYQGTSYTSKKSVPIGTPLNNAEYWAITGNFNAQVEQYRQDVISYAGEVDEYKVKVDSEISNRISADTALDNKISAETNNRTEMGTVLDNKISTKKPKKRSYILIGDSFSVGLIDANNLGTNRGWIGHFKEMVGDRANVYYNKTAMPGVSGFASSLSFLSLLHGAEETFTDKSQITDIVVMGGTNDANFIANVPNKISEFCSYVHANYPFANISIGVIGTFVQQNIPLIEAYRSCINYGARFIKTSTHLYCDRSYLSDGTHLKQAGYDFYAKYTNEIIEFGETSYSFGFPFNIGGVSGLWLVKENGIQVWYGATTFTVANQYIAANGGTELSTIDSPPIALLPYTVVGTASLYELAESGADIPRLVCTSRVYASDTTTSAVRIEGGLMYPWTKNETKIYRYVFHPNSFMPY